MILFSLLGLGMVFFSEGAVILTISLLVVSSFFQFNMYSSGVWVDSMSWSMAALSLFVSSLLLFSSSKSKSSMILFIFLSLEIVLLFFLTNSLMIFFMMFEMSLVPLMFLILTWGRQSERLLATQFMLIYTIVASVPLLLFVTYSSIESGTSSFFLLSLFPEKSVSETLLTMSMIAFFVKIPMFFLHSWLPKAHVEAPLEGSMILAGIMLKVGTFGMIRVMMISDLSPLFLFMIMTVSLVGSLYSSIIALSSDDMKMSVAFSSISHMNMVVASIVSLKMSGAVAAVIIMVAHGICSPLLFYLVTKIYLSTHSRSILVSKGNFSKSPFLGTLGLLTWIVNISAPPFFSFLGELMGFSSIVSSIPISVLWVVGFLVVGSFYSIYNYGTQSHSPHKSLSKNENGEDMMFALFTSLMILISAIIFLFSPPLYG